MDHVRHRMSAGLGRHRLEVAAMEHIEEEGLDDVIAVMARARGGGETGVFFGAPGGGPKFFLPRGFFFGGAPKIGLFTQKGGKFFLPPARGGAKGGGGGGGAGGPGTQGTGWFALGTVHHVEVGVSRSRCGTPRQRLKVGSAELLRGSLACF